MADETGLTERDKKIAEELKRRLSEVIPILDFKVFGSRARERGADECSDMDIFLEVEDIDKQAREKIGDIFWEVGFENFLVISPLIFTREEIEDSPLRSSPIVRKIKEKGVGI